MHAGKNRFHVKVKGMMLQLNLFIILGVSGPESVDVFFSFFLQGTGAMPPNMMNSNMGPAMMGPGGPHPMGPGGSGPPTMMGPNPNGGPGMAGPRGPPMMMHPGNGAGMGSNVGSPGGPMIGPMSMSAAQRLQGLYFANRALNLLTSPSCQ